MLRFLALAYVACLFLNTGTVLIYAICIGITAVSVFLWLFVGMGASTRERIVWYSTILATAAIPILGRTPAAAAGFMAGIGLNMGMYEMIGQNGLPRRGVRVLVVAMGVVALVYAAISGKWNTTIYGSSNYVVSLVLLALFLADEYCWDSRFVRGWAYAYAVLFTLLARSRSGLIAVGVYFFLSRIRRPRSRFVASVVAFSATAVVTQYILPNYGAGLTFWGKTLSASSNRVTLWSQGWSLVLQHPWGYGYLGYSDLIVSQHSTFQSPHSLYLNVLLQGGIPYGILLVFFLALLLARCHSRAAVACVMAMLCRGFLESSSPFGYTLGSALLVLPLFVAEGNRRELKKSMRMDGHASTSPSSPSAAD